MDRRKQILRAAAKVYAQHGFRGSTTRRIADAAQVNEVTIFRYFGSKDALLNEAVAKFAGGPHIIELPDKPVEPGAELSAWCASVIHHLRTMRSMVRKCMGELEERPELTCVASEAPTHCSLALRDYLLRLRAAGFVSKEFDATAAAAMLMGALFSDAMGRDMMPQVYPQSPEKSAESYTKLLLRAIGGDRVATTVKKAS